MRHRLRRCYSITGHERADRLAHNDAVRRFRSQITGRFAATASTRADVVQAGLAGSTTGRNLMQ